MVKYFDRSDADFLKELQDPWESSRNQVGHFLTAVSWAYQGFEGTGLQCMIGHEKRSDTFNGSDFAPGKVVRGAFQCLVGATQQEVDWFNQALIADEVGDRCLRDQLIEQMLPGLTDDPTIAAPGREGNSWQDMLLTIKGVSMGRQIRNGTMVSIEHASDWLAVNLMGAHLPIRK